jgi:ribosome biogenesis protein Tsr3
MNFMGDALAVAISRFAWGMKFNTRCSKLIDEYKKGDASTEISEDHYSDQFFFFEISGRIQL